MTNIGDKYANIRAKRLIFGQKRLIFGQKGSYWGANINDANNLACTMEMERGAVERRPKSAVFSCKLVCGPPLGFAFARLVCRIAKNFPKYLYTSPAIIPIQGEHPHGTCHILHMGWRPYSAFGSSPS